ncbi:MAG: protein-export chaperone SecB [Gammaproteobacteria bacterium]|nr:protein-export chaperone SecB [Gammaproteobacteria bacterium]
MKDPQIILHSRYIRDFSFENFGAPALPGEADPVFDITVEVENRETRDMHEVMLSVRVAAKREEQISFLIDLSYAGLYQISGMGGPERRRFLHTEAPRMLFPFVDRICADVTRDGGLPPLALTPPDFTELAENSRREADRAAAVPATT